MDIDEATRDVPQSESLNDAQVPNNAGGFVFQIDDEARLRRFVILGADANNYYVSRNAMELQNAKCVLRLLASGKGEWVVEEVTRISQEGRAPRQSPGIFVLAICAQLGDPATRRAALAAVPAVCRTASTLFEWVQRCKELGARKAGGDGGAADPRAVLDSMAEPTAAGSSDASDSDSNASGGIFGSRGGFRGRGRCGRGGAAAAAGRGGKVGWGRAMRRTIALWYLEKAPAAVAYQATKYSQRSGWSHADLLRLAHPDPEHHAAKRRKREAAAAAAAVGGELAKLEVTEAAGKAEGEEGAEGGGAASEQGALAAAAAAAAAEAAAAASGEVDAEAMAAAADALRVADMKAIFAFLTHGTLPGQEKPARRRKAAAACEGEAMGSAAAAAVTATAVAEGASADSGAGDAAGPATASPSGGDGEGAAEHASPAALPAAMDSDTSADPAASPVEVATTVTAMDSAAAPAASEPAAALDIPAADAPAPAADSDEAVPIAADPAAPAPGAAPAPDAAAAPAPPAVAAAEAAPAEAAPAEAAPAEAAPAEAAPAAAAHDAAPAPAAAAHDAALPLPAPAPDAAALSPVMQYLFDAHRLRKVIRAPPPLVKAPKPQRAAKRRRGQPDSDDSASDDEGKAAAAAAAPAAGDEGKEEPAPQVSPEAAAAHAAAHTAAVESAVELIRQHRFGHEHVGDTALLRQPELWSAFLEVGMPLTALIRNLGRMTSLGVMGREPCLDRITSRLRDARALTAARVHPMSVLDALCTYRAGRGARGVAAWTPVPAVCDALEAAFYLSFKNLRPTGQRYLVGLDVSGSMGSPCAGMAAVHCNAAAAAVLMCLARTEPWLKTMAFTHELVPFDVSPADKLEDVTSRAAGLPFGGTDCALPILHATEQRLPVDVFVILTDNETWFGRTHPAKALRAYRAAMSLPASKLVVLAFSSSGFSIADPEDPGMLDVAGLDSAVPRLVADFVSGRV